MTNSPLVKYLSFLLKKRKGKKKEGGEEGRGRGKIIVKKKKD